MVTFFVVYKLGRSHLVVDELSWMLNLTKQIGVLNQTTYIIFFLLQLVWLHGISKYLSTKMFLVHYNQEQKKKLDLKALHFFGYRDNYIIKVKTNSSTSIPHLV
jgi:hypothetical protein